MFNSDNPVRRSPISFSVDNYPETFTREWINPSNGRLTVFATAPWELPARKFLPREGFLFQQSKTNSRDTTRPEEYVIDTRMILRPMVSSMAPGELVRCFYNCDAASQHKVSKLWTTPWIRGEIMDSDETRKKKRVYKNKGIVLEVLPDLTGLGMVLHTPVYSGLVDNSRMSRYVDEDTLKVNVANSFRGKVKFFAGPKSSIILSKIAPVDEGFTITARTFETNAVNYYAQKIVSYSSEELVIHVKRRDNIGIKSNLSETTQFDITFDFDPDVYALSLEDLEESLALWLAGVTKLESIRELRLLDKTRRIEKTKVEKKYLPDSASIIRSRSHQHVLTLNGFIPSFLLPYRTAPSSRDNLLDIVNIDWNNVRPENLSIGKDAILETYIDAIRKYCEYAERRQFANWAQIKRAAKASERYGEEDTPTPEDTSAIAEDFIPQQIHTGTPFMQQIQENKIQVNESDKAPYAETDAAESNKRRRLSLRIKVPATRFSPQSTTQSLYTKEKSKPRSLYTIEPASHHVPAFATQPEFSTRPTTRSHLVSLAQSSTFSPSPIALSTQSRAPSLELPPYLQALYQPESEHQGSVIYDDDDVSTALDNWMQEDDFHKINDVGYDDLDLF